MPSPAPTPRPPLPLTFFGVLGVVVTVYLGAVSLGWGLTPMLGDGPMPRGGYPIAHRDLLWPAAVMGALQMAVAGLALRRRSPGLALLTAVLLQGHVVQIMVTGGSLGFAFMVIVTEVPTLALLFAACRWWSLRRRQQRDTPSAAMPPAGGASPVSPSRG